MEDSTQNIRPFLHNFLSQWNRSDFTVDGQEFVCVEQYMMFRKARLFGDDMIAEKIMATDSPADHKRLGRQVRGFTQDVWDVHKIEIVTTGNRAKFSQNSGLRKKLLATGEDWLVEANPKDIIWGVGLSETDPDIWEPSKWRGQNLLGEVLMKVRSELRDASGA